MYQKTYYTHIFVLCLIKLSLLGMQVGFYSLFFQFDTKPLFITSADTSSYLLPIEDYIKTGIYTSTVRMPGYGIIYLFFRSFYSVLTSQNLLVLSQVILSSLNICLLSRMALLLFEAKLAYYITLILFLFSSFTAYYDTWILTESFAVSAFIFAVYFGVRYFKSLKAVDLFLASIFFTWLIFLRLVHFPLFLLLIVFLSIKVWRTAYFSLQKKLIHLALFLLPFLIADGYWTLYNYQTNKIFNPLALKIRLQGFGSHLADFCSSWGGSPVFWEKNAEINSFCYYDLYCTEGKISFPLYIFTSKFNADSLENIKQTITKTKLLSNEREKQEKFTYLAHYFDSLSLSIKKEKPHIYYFVAPLVFVEKLVLHSGSYYLFTEKYDKLSLPKKIVKVFTSALYWFIFIAGMVTCAIFTIRNFLKMNELLFISIIPFYIVFVHAAVLRVPEPRFLVSAYPFWVLMAAGGLSFLYEKILLFRGEQK